MAHKCMHAPSEALGGDLPCLFRASGSGHQLSLAFLALQLRNSNLCLHHPTAFFLYVSLYVTDPLNGFELVLVATSYHG